MTTPLRTGLTAIVAAAVIFATGCLPVRRAPVMPMDGVPKELNKTTHPDYIIEPPDVLQIDLIAAVPKPPYKLQPLDAISLRATGVDPNVPLSGVFQIDTDGTLNLGSAYGVASISGKTVGEAKDILLALLKKNFLAPNLDVALAQSRGMQQVRGPHLVRADGSVWFDVYGSVRVVGLTLPQAVAAVEEHLSQFFLEPKVAMNITGYNSKVFYLIFDTPFSGGGQVGRFPVTGNETVLDAVSQIGGMSQTADYKRIWIARPAPVGSCPQILPVDWKAITEKADVATNYQILPGDRLFVKTAPMVAFGAQIDRVLSPIERILGFFLLAQSVALNRQDLQNGVGNLGGR